MRRRHWRRRRQLGARPEAGAGSGRGNRRQSSMTVRVACLGMGWWSDVLADAIKRSGKLTITACYSRSEEKRQKFSAKYNCRAARSYDELLNDRSIEAVINTTPNSVHLETTSAAAKAGKHVFL